MRGRVALGYVFLTLTAAAVCGASAVVIPHALATTDHHARARSATPSAEEFASILARTANAAAEAGGDRSRVTGPRCVQAAAGRYMCTYLVVRPGRSAQCHLMQARWTANDESPFEVTLAGRTARCGTLREAIHSLS